ncbi:MAG: glycosyltransferase family 39 protein [Planctomycetota bacterium]
MPIRKLVCHPLTFLLILCLGIGIYKIAVLACVSNDSVTFMEFARFLKLCPDSIIKSSDQHPGYPAIICASEWILGKLGCDPALEHRIIAAQSATLICRTIAICFLYSVFRFFGNKKYALVSAILVLLIPVYANNGSEVLSDWPNLMLMAIALYLCLRGLRNTSRLCFFAAGFSSGLAYWVRPEGAVFVVVFGIYTLLQTFTRTDKSRLWVHFGIMVIAAGLITAPYMFYKGALFPKKKIGYSSVSSESHNTTVSTPRCRPFQTDIAAGTLPLKPAKAMGHFVEKLFNTVFLLSVPLLGVFLYRMKGFKRLAPRDQFLMLFIALWMGLMIWLHCRHGYMSYRHIMPLVVFGFAWILKGLHGVVLMFGSSRQKLNRNTAAVIGICIALFVPKLIRPAHADKAVYKQAGLWLRDNTPAEVTLAVFDNRIGFYAERLYSLSNIQTSLREDYLIIKADEEFDRLPKTALPVTTGQDELDKFIRIYQIVP